MCCICVWLWNDILIMFSILFEIVWHMQNYKIQQLKLSVLTTVILLSFSLSLSALSSVLFTCQRIWEFFFFLHSSNEHFLETITMIRMLWGSTEICKGIYTVQRWRINKTKKKLWMPISLVCWTDMMNIRILLEIPSTSLATVTSITIHQVIEQYSAINNWKFILNRKGNQ